jgi:hypothetical protein
LLHLIGANMRWAQHSLGVLSGNRVANAYNMKIGEVQPLGDHARGVRA